MAARLGDDDIRRIFRLLPNPSDLKACSLVCRRWLRLYGNYKTEVRLLDWMMLESGRLMERFPALESIDLCPAWSNSSDPELFGSTAVHMTRGDFTMRLDPDLGNPFGQAHGVDEQSPSPERFDSGLRELVTAYPMLRCLRLVDVFRVKASDLSLDTLQADSYLPYSFYCLQNPNAERDVLQPGGNSLGETKEQRAMRLRYAEDYTDSGPQGLAIVASNCEMLQELEVRQCTDDTLKALEACSNLQVVKLVGAIPGFYFATFTDRGLRSLAHKCPRIVELSLAGCSVGRDGLQAVAMGCPMLLELTLCGRSFRPDWLSALSACLSLQTLKLENFQQQSPEEAAAALQDMGRIEEEREEDGERYEEEDMEEGGGETEEEDVPESGGGGDNGEIGEDTEGDDYTKRNKLSSNKGKRKARQKYGHSSLSSSSWTVRTVAPVERLQLVHCDLRSDVFLRSLLKVCAGVRRVEIRNCWGLEDSRVVHFGECR